MKLFQKLIPRDTKFIYQELPTGAVESDETFRNSDLYMIGDSLTVGMAGSIPGVRSDAEVGRSVRDMPAAMERALNASPRPEVISIMGGTNDGGDVNQIRTAYSAMLAAARQAGVKVIVATLPPLRGRDLTEANNYIRGLASSEVTVVELANYPVGGDSVHFSGYGAPANEILNTARSLDASHEANTVEALLRGEINPDAPITDAAIEAAAERMARAIPGSLDLEVLLGEALETVGEIGDDAAINTLAETVEDLIEDEAAAQEAAELTSDEVVQMQGINNLEFLELPAGDRLRLITTANVASERVADGTVDSLTFTFTFESQYNEALWRDTTAGQVLPSEVRSVNSGGQVFSRRGTSLNGEFFTETGQRLKIHEGTGITDIETGDLTEIQANIDEQLEAFETVEEGEDARTQGELLVAQMAIEHGVQPEFVMAAFVDEDNPIATEDAPHLTSDEARLAAMPGAVAAQQLTTEFSAQLQYFLTDIDRVQGDFNGRFSDEEPREANRLNPNFAAFFLGEGRDQEAVNAIMTAAGYSAEEIEAAESYVSARQEFNSRGATNPLNSEILESGEINVIPEKQDQVNAAVEVAMSNRQRYERVADITGVPWELIAGIHYRESSANFSTYLHNGQPLGQRTTIVPRGILFHNWEEAAIDALQGGYGNPSEADLASQANFAERFNGMGYNNRGLSSPYVWAGTPRYETQGGMFVADGEFSRTTRDPRIGVMPIVMLLRARQGKDNEGAPSQE